MYKPTEEQAAIVAAASESDRNLLVSALAGAAKTSTLELIAKALPSTEILALAFNKKMAVEMQERMPSNVKAMTLNALGHRTWMDATGRRLKINAAKTYDIANELIRSRSSAEQSVLWEQFAELLRIVDFGKACGYIPTDHFDQAKALMRDEDFFGHLEQKLSDTEEDFIRAVTLTSLQMAMKGDCDFNDQVLMPTVFHGAFPRYALVLVDEAQDLSALNHATLRKLVGKRRLIAVGDPCQPEGSLISIVKKKADSWKPSEIEQVPIEQLKIGDILVGFDQADGSFFYNRKVEGITARPYVGQLVCVVTENGVTRYTTSHHCFANFSSLRTHTALYLMRAGTRWRLGTAAMDYKESSGPISRARVEKADGLWLLATFPERRDALIAEAAVQAVYGIPDVTFEWAGITSLGYADKAALQEVWEKLADINFEARAVALLEDFGRKLAYPLWTPKQDYASLKRPMIVRACNLLPQCLVLPYTGKKVPRKTDWKDCEIVRTPYKGQVYSLTVSHNQLYIADGIVTHNCQAIYGFRGAHEESMSLLREEFDMQELPLTISFRCPQSVVKHVRWRAPVMRWPEWAKPGEVRTLAAWTSDLFEDDAVIICRNNAPLFAVAIKLLKTSRSCELHGRDVVASLTKIMRKFGGHDLPQHEVIGKIDAWLAAEMEKTKPRAHDRLKDRAECMMVFAQEGATLGDALAYAQHLSQLRSPLKLMTGHGSKGLEFDHVYFLDEKLVGREDQEPNLRYVIATRARETLTYIRTEDFAEKVTILDEVGDITEQQYAAAMLGEDHNNGGI